MPNNKNQVGPDWLNIQETREKKPDWLITLEKEYYARIKTNTLTSNN